MTSLRSTPADYLQTFPSPPQLSQHLIGVKNIILAASTDGKMTPLRSFMIGALSKTLATVVTFPYILSKIRLQARDTPYKGAVECLSTIYKQKGIAGWYQGMQAQITKAVLAQALLFYFRDHFEVITKCVLACKCRDGYVACRRRQQLLMMNSTDSRLISSARHSLILLPIVCRQILNKKRAL